MSRVEWLDAGHMSPKVHNGDEEMADGNTPAGEDSTDIIGLSLGGDTSLVIYGLPSEVLAGLHEAMEVVKDRIDRERFKPAPEAWAGAEPHNIADDPQAIRDFLAGDEIRTPIVKNRAITAGLHLREVEDGYWQRINVKTRIDDGAFMTYLSYDLHKNTPHGEAVKLRVGMAYVELGRKPVLGRYSDKKLIQAHREAAARLTVAHVKTVMESE
ncbi:hypothetical protein SEA_MUFASA8_68 [Arthrobacter phage Mufasa8]|uniref:Uncharacterized protein n=1 Tax=Arthrobacter phage Mufasa8 TaxID=2656526 RepID=A0A649VM82_9CAUD|nr:hypothetical protein HYQ08_gp068 [Arthrobacter phage Mufasa8]QGJ93516.1 hypothetical protein SEA_MUFASA8_68 [Arthrobacter phage Mufasa8]